MSYDKPLGLDVTQFGADSFNGAASISLYDADTYDTVWGANTLFGGEVTLELNGSTVTGRGVFLAGEDGARPGVAGELEANCWLAAPSPRAARAVLELTSSSRSVAGSPTCSKR